MWWFTREISELCAIGSKKYEKTIKMKTKN